MFRILKISLKMKNGDYSGCRGRTANNFTVKVLITLHGVLTKTGKVLDVKNSVAF